MLTKSESIFKGIGSQILAAVTGSLVAASDGMSFGWTSPMIPYLLNENLTHIEATHIQADWLETISLLGAFCALPFTIYLVDKIGRKRSLLLGATVMFLSWIAIGLADRIEYLYVARFFSGFAGDLSFVAASMYIAEIAEPRIRGFLSSIVYFMVLTGLVIAYSIGPFAPFYSIPIAGGIVSGSQLLIFAFMPESPYYLTYKEKPEEARESLTRLRTADCDIDKEMRLISETIARQKKEKGRPQDLILVPSNRNAIIIMAFLNAGQHMSSKSVMYMNLHPILEAAGSIYMDNNITAIVFAVVMLLTSLLASLTVDKFGRKFMLIISSLLTAFCLLALSVYFHLQYLNYDVTSVSWVPIVSVLVYAGVLTYGLGLIPIVITGEIFPAPIKAIGMTVTDIIFVLGSIVSIQVYQLLQIYGMYVPFYVFTVSAFLMMLFCCFCVPETKGKTLDEIQLMLKGEKMEKTKRKDNSISA